MQGITSLYTTRIYEILFLIATQDKLEQATDRNLERRRYYSKQPLIEFGTYSNEIIKGLNKGGVKRKQKIAILLPGIKAIYVNDEIDLETKMIT